MKRKHQENSVNQIHQKALFYLNFILVNILKNQYKY